MLIKHLAPALIWALVILLLCSIPGNQLPETPFWDLFAFDKIAHLVLFMILSLLIKVGLLKQHRFALFKYRVNAITLTTSVSYGVLIEILQGSLFVERYADINDMLANALGAALGLLLFKIIYGNCLRNK